MTDKGGLWVVKFRPDMHDEPIKVYAEDVDMMDMPMIYVRGIRTKHRSAIIEMPKDEAFEELVECDPLIIPYVNIVHIGKLKDPTKVFPLGVAGGKEDPNGSGIHAAGRRDEHG